MKRNGMIKLALILNLIGASCLMAEPIPMPQPQQQPQLDAYEGTAFSDWNVNPDDYKGPYSGSSVNNVGGLVAPIVGNAQSLQGFVPVLNDSETNVTDRKDNSNDMANRSDAGKGAAIAAGTTMISTGTPMTMSINPIIVAAGWTLVNMGITELAQAAAMQNSKEDFQAGRDYLSRDDFGSQTPARANNAPPIPDGLDDFLRGRGLNPEDFMRRLANGEISDPLAAMGAPKFDLSKEDSSKVALLVNQTLGKEHLEALKIDENVGIDEAKAQSLALGSPDALNAPAKKDANSDSSLLSQAGSRGEGSEASGRSGSRVNGAKGSAEAHDGGGHGLPFGVDGILAQFGHAPGEPGFGAAKLDILNQLEKAGVVVIPKGQNIFQRAARIYRSYKRWRGTRIAHNNAVN